MSILVVIMCTLRIDIDPGLVFEYCHPLWLLLITAMVIMIILTTTRAAALNLDFIREERSMLNTSSTAPSEETKEAQTTEQTPTDQALAEQAQRPGGGRGYKKVLLWPVGWHCWRQ